MGDWFSFTEHCALKLCSHSLTAWRSSNLIPTPNVQTPVQENNLIPLDLDFFLNLTRLQSKQERETCRNSPRHLGHLTRAQTEANVSAKSSRWDLEVLMKPVPPPLFPSQCHHRSVPEVPARSSFLQPFPSISWFQHSPVSPSLHDSLE